MKTTVYSTDPKPFIKDGSFVCVVNTENESEYGIVVNSCVYFQNGGFDFLENVLPDKRSSDKDYRINSVWTKAMGFDSLEVPDWKYRKTQPMPKLETGMFVYVWFPDNKNFGGLGVVVGNDIVYRNGGHDHVSTFDAKGVSSSGRCQITDVVYGEYVSNFNSAKTIIDNGTPMESPERSLWKAQD